MTRIAIYPGSFDPITMGHLDILDRTLRIFDKVIIAVGEHMEKDTLFSVEERLQQIREAVKGKKNVEVAHFEGLMIDYARRRKADVIIRGLRAVSDFEYEFQMALMNRKLDSDIETVFIMTRGKYSYLNSSVVKEVARHNGRITDLVPAAVEKASLALKYNSSAETIWRISAFLVAFLADCLAPPMETKTMEAKTPIMAITTNNSIKVNPLFFFLANICNIIC